MCDSKAWLISSACKNLRAQHPLRAKILCPEKCALERVNMHLYNFLLCRPKFTRFLLSNVEGVVVDHLCFRFLIRRPFLQIFAIKVESCQKSRRNWTFLALPNFRGQAFQKLYARYHPCLATSRLEKFHEDIPTSPEVIGVHMLNFKPNFKFSRLEFFLGGPLSHFGCALSRLGQYLARVKIWGRSTL